MGHACEEVVVPGTVALLEHEMDVALSTWGVVIPYDYWAEGASRKARDTFHEYSKSIPQIPILEFGADETWKFCFRQFGSTVKPLCPLEEFLEKKKPGPVPMTLYACSLRDGDRYHRSLLRWLWFLAQPLSRDFTEEELRMETIGTQRLIAHGTAIRTWKEAQNALEREQRDSIEPYGA